MTHYVEKVTKKQYNRGKNINQGSFLLEKSMGKINLKFELLSHSSRRILEDENPASTSRHSPDPEV